MRIPFLLGRLIFGGFFLYNGINHFKQRRTLVKYVIEKKVLAPQLAVTASGVVLVLGGAIILLGIKPKFGTAVVAGFPAAVSPIMHDFWHVDDPGERTNEMVNFSKNMALLGSTLALMAVEEPWPVSVPVAQPGKGQQVRRSLSRLIVS